MQRLMEFKLWFFFATVLIACNDNDSCTMPDLVVNIPVDIEIVRLEDQLFQATSEDDVQTILEDNPVVTDYFLGGTSYPSDSILASYLFKRIKNPYTDTLYSEAREAFANIDWLKKDLEDAFKYLKSYDPDTKTPVVKTIVTGFGSSEMFVSDSLIIIGLDYFIGPEGSYDPPDYPKYILKRYQKEYIVPAIMLILSNYYIKDDPKDQTMLADMIYYGKKYYFTKEMIPCAHDSLLIWYSGNELNEVNKNQDIIWANFIVNELLFETSHIEKRKYMDERPAVFEIGDKCPGRIGGWVGWEIVKQYMQENPVPLNQLMNETDANKIFTESRYKPDKSRIVN